MFNKDDIYLRKVEPKDLPFLYLWENDSTAWADSDTHNPLSQKDLRDYIESSTGDIYKDGQLRLIIERRVKHHSETPDYLETSEKSEYSDFSDYTQTLGCIDLFDFDPHNRKAAVGMYIANEARGQGVGKIAVQLLEQYAFEFLRLRMLYVFISEYNSPCLTTYRKCNWKEVSLLPHWLLTGGVIVFEKINI